MKLESPEQLPAGPSITIEATFKILLPNTTPIFIDYLKMIELRLLLAASVSGAESFPSTFTRTLFVNSYKQTIETDHDSVFSIECDKISLFFDGTNRIVVVNTPANKQAEFTYEELYLYASETGTCKGAPAFDVFDVKFSDTDICDWAIPNTSIVLRKQGKYLGFFDTEQNIHSCPSRIHFPHHWKNETKYPWASSDTPAEWLETETGRGYRDLSEKNIRTDKDLFMSYLF